MATARNVTVNVIGDATGFTKAMGTVGTASETTGSKLSGAFRSSFSAISSATGGAFAPLQDAMDSIGGGMDGLSGKSMSLGEKMAGVGLGVAGAGAALTAFGSKDQSAQQQLSQAIENTGGTFDDYKDQIDKTVSSMAKYGSSSSTTQNALQTLTQATKDPQKAIDLMGTAANLAAAKHEDLGAASTQLSQILAGKGTKTLTAMGITLKDASGNATTAQQRIDQLSQMVGGQASAASDTYTGKMKALKTEVENAAAAFGQKYGPAMTAAGAGVSVLGGAVTGVKAVMDHFKTATDAAALATDGKKVADLGGAVATGVQTTATEGATAANLALDTSMLPIILTIGLIIAIIAVFAFVIYELVTHWTAVWTGIKAVLADAWGFITGTVGSVVDFIKNHWQLLLAILTGPIGLAVLFIKNHFDQIIGFVTGLPGRIASVAVGMWDGIKNAFRSAINWLIDIWNGLGFTLPAINWGPIHLGGGRIQVPQIPHLAAGGIVSAPTLALLGESGPEAVVPLGAGGNGMGGGGDLYTVNTVLTVDGRAFASATAQYTRDELLRGTARSTGRVGLG